MLVRCLYASRATVPLVPAVLDSILDQCMRNNSRLGITGLLCHEESTFVQVLEGGRDEVCHLLNTIMRDERHRDVRLLMFDEIAERRFGNWTMGQVNVGKVNPALLLKYSERAELDPFKRPGAATMALLEELAASGVIATRIG